VIIPTVTVGCVGPDNLGQPQNPWIKPNRRNPSVQAEESTPRSPRILAIQRMRSLGWTDACLFLDARMKKKKGEEPIPCCGGAQRRWRAEGGEAERDDQNVHEYGAPPRVRHRCPSLGSRCSPVPGVAPALASALLWWLSVD
jgi:hypothetical protein